MANHEIDWDIVWGAPGRLLARLNDDDALTFRDSDGATKVVGGPGGSTAGVPRVYAIPFAFDTPDLLTGHTVYTPTVGDLLLDAMFLVTTAWNGTTPFADIATFVGVDRGMWGQINNNQAFYLSSAGNEAGGTGMFLQPGLQADGGEQCLSISGIGTQNGEPIVPALFTATNPLKLVISQNGKVGGGDPGSTQGEAILYLVIATPVAP